MPGSTSCSRWWGAGPWQRAGLIAQGQSDDEVAFSKAVFVGMDV